MILSQDRLKSEISKIRRNLRKQFVKENPDLENITFVLGSFILEPFQAMDRRTGSTGNLGIRVTAKFTVHWRKPTPEGEFKWISGLNSRTGIVDLY